MNRSLIQIATFMAASLSTNAIKLTYYEDYDVGAEAEAVGDHMKWLNYEELRGLDGEILYDRYYGHLKEFVAGSDQFDKLVELIPGMGEDEVHSWLSKVVTEVT